MQALLLLLVMAWRLDFGERAPGFAEHCFAKEGAAFGLIRSLSILTMSRLIAYLETQSIELH